MDEAPSTEEEPFSRTLVFSSATSWSKVLLRPITFLRWWMEWILHVRRRVQIFFLSGSRTPQCLSKSHSLLEATLL